MKTISKGELFFGYFPINCKSINKGIVFYKSRPFAHVWEWQHNDFGNINKWQLNKDEVAGEMNYNGQKLFENLESLMEYCDQWIKENEKV